jgi:putative addiction module CopG family antidote
LPLAFAGRAIISRVPNDDVSIAMPATRQLTVTLPEDLVDRVHEKVASGEYESEAEVIRDGLEALEEDRRRFESWLREEVVPALEALEADPSRAVSIEDVEAMLDEEYERSVGKAG